MHDASYWSIEARQLLDDVALAIAAVNDDGKVQAKCQAKVAIEPFLLLGEWGSVPVSVQSGLSDRDDARSSGEVFNDRPVVRGGLGSVVGMDADGREQAAMDLRKLDRLRAGLGR